MKPTIFEINTFDTSYASYIRSRAMRDFLLAEKYPVIYSEANYQPEINSSQLRRNGARTIKNSYKYSLTPLKIAKTVRGYCSRYFFLKMCENYNKNHSFTPLNITQTNSLFGFTTATTKRLFYVLTLKYEVLFLHQLSILTAPLILVAKLKGKKIIIDWDDLASSVQSTSFRSWLGRMAEQPFVVRKADLILSHNPLIIAEAKKLSKTPVEYVTQGINTQRFNIKRYQKYSSGLKNKLKIAGKNVLIYAVSFNTGGVSDLDIILKAMKIVERKDPNIILLVLGGGPLLRKYQKQESANVQFLGLIPHNDIPKYLSLADAGLVFMRNNLGNRMKMSLKTLEYLSMPIPVVGHLVGGTQKAVGKYIVESGKTSISLANVILQSIKKPIRIQPVCREYIINNFGKEVMRRQFLEALSKLI